jgi:ferredoxin
MVEMTTELQLDPIKCTGHGLCAELLGELIELDEWGYPIVGSKEVPAAVLRDARRAVSACPTLALRLTRAPATAGAGRAIRAGRS